MPKALTNAKPAALFEQGLKSHNLTGDLLHQAKNAALLAGWFFIQSRNTCEHGEWLDLLKEFEAKISERTVRRYILFTEDALVSVIAEKRKLTDEQVKAYQLTHRELADTTLRDAAGEVVIQSAANFTELARELRLFRKFGEYDSVQHAAATARAAKAAPRQIEFNWDLALGGLQSLKAIERVPVDKLDTAKLTQLETELETALAKVREAKANLHATDVPTPSSTAAGEPTPGRTGTNAQKP